MYIGKRKISVNEKPFIIAETGINHNGEIDKAFKMIEIAKNIGFDAVKFQTFKAEEFVFDEKQTYTYQSQGKTITESMLEMFKRCEFTKDEWYSIKKKCDQEDILFLSTPQNYSDLELLLDIGIPAIKVGSDDFTNIPLLQQYKETNLPLMLSCGMADLAEVYTSLEAVQLFAGYPIILLLCTSQYPTPPEDVNLLKLKTLSHLFPDLILGFSDHTQGVLAASTAVAFQACVFEKHFTLDHNLPGPDHWFSEDPESMKIWYDSVLSSWEMLGNPVVKPTEKEKSMRKLARRSIIVKKDIEAGEIFDISNTGLFRPGNGLPPIMLKEFLGKKADKALKKGSFLRFCDIADYS